MNKFESKVKLLERLSEAIPEDANITFATVSWWTDNGGTHNCWDSDSDETN